jgi:hypothetical protein
METNIHVPPRKLAANSNKNNFSQNVSPYNCVVNGKDNISSEGVLKIQKPLEVLFLFRPTIGYSCQDI